jgi:hypothetical protein
VEIFVGIGIGALIVSGICYFTTGAIVQGWYILDKMNEKKAEQELIKALMGSGAVVAIKPEPPKKKKMDA